MNKAQRFVLIFGAIGVLHSSMVPPVEQGDDGVCRYHQFVERSGLFTREYDVAAGDPVALLSEYGVLLAVTAIVFLALGFQRKN